LGKPYHKDHFLCASCNDSLSGKYFNDNGNPKCEKCFSKIAKICAGCSKPILEKQYSAMDRIWHLECFKCGVCGEAFPNN